MSGIYRGSTPTNEFTVDLDLTDADVIYITYKQGNQIVCEKSIDDITVTSSKLTVKLTQEDTLKFEERLVEIQIRARFPNGDAVASTIIKTTAHDVLKDGVI